MLHGEPDAGNLHVRFEEGRVDRPSLGRPLSYSTGFSASVSDAFPRARWPLPVTQGRAAEEGKIRPPLRYLAPYPHCHPERSEGSLQFHRTVLNPEMLMRRSFAAMKIAVPDPLTRPAPAGEGAVAGRVRGILPIG